MTVEEMTEKVRALEDEIAEAGFGHLFITTDLNINGLKEGKIDLVIPSVQMGCYGNKELIAFMIMEFLAENHDIYKQVRAVIFTAEANRMVKEAREEGDLEGNPEDLGLPPKDWGFTGGNDEGGNC